MLAEFNERVAAFFKKDSAGGIILMLAAALALVFANTPLDSIYELFLATPMEIRVGALVIAKPLLLWINDGLMAVFFFVVGLELKREVVEGELSKPSNIALPAIGAIGGMAVPALIFILFNSDNSFEMQGWAIPAATDIAFALGVLALLGSRVPVTIKVFLASLAIFDDVGAIIIIAIFYTEQISLTAITVVACCLPILYILNRSDVSIPTPYVMVGLVMWVATLKSGVHATLAAVILAMFIPMRSKKNPEKSLVTDMEHSLHSVVAFFVVPVFAFANAGLDLRNVGFSQVFHSVPIGIALGLFLGKQIGIFGICFLAIKTRLTQLPKGVTWMQLWGTSAICGIGFTMSLFIGTLAYTEDGQLFDERLGIIVGSLASGLMGYWLLSMSLPKSGAEVSKAAKSGH